MTLRTSILMLAVAFTACGPADAFVDDQELDTLGAESELGATTGRFEIFVGKDGQHYFHLLAGNGEKILASEGYTSIAGARGGIASVKSNGLNTQRYLQREARDGSRYFVVTAANGEIIGVSEMYVSAANAERGAATVQKVVGNIISENVATEGDSRYQVFKGLDGKYYFHLKANNGQIVLQSQAYASKASATNGVSSVKTNGSIVARYEVRLAADGKHYFVLKAANGAVIGVSEMYVSKYNAERGITAVINVVSSAK